MNPARHTSKVLAVATAALALAMPAQAADRVYVPEPTFGCANRGCLGPSDLKYKPKTWYLRDQNAGGIHEIKVTGLKWKRWGKSKATGTGTAHGGDPDNGFIRTRITVTVSRIVAAGCSDEAGQFRAYSRVRYSTSASTFGSGSFNRMLAC